jgi:hypothetical protein
MIIGKNLSALNEKTGRAAPSILTLQKNYALNG